MSAKKSKSKSSNSRKPGKTIASIEVISDEPETAKSAKQSKAAKPPKEPKVKKFSALDAAAQLLAHTSQPLNCKQLIELMTAQGLWTSPKGKTPASTLYAAIIREIKAKGEQSRFIRADAGKFTSKAHGSYPRGMVGCTFGVSFHLLVCSRSDRVRRQTGKDERN